MTVEERMQVVEGQVKSHSERLDRHSNRLQKLEAQSQDVSDMKEEMKQMKKSILKIEKHQELMDAKLVKKSNLTLILLCTVVALLVHIAVKSPETAKEVVAITSTAVKTGVTAL